MKKEIVLPPPVWTRHADYNNPFEPINWLRSIVHLDTDIKLESKVKDLSLIQLRNDLARHAPDLCTSYGIDKTQAAEDVEEVVEVDEQLGSENNINS